MLEKQSDVCLILEGTYPFVRGGVSTWAHELIESQPHMSFHLVAIVAPNAKNELKYTLPANVTGLTVLTLQDLPEDTALSGTAATSLHRRIQPQLEKLISRDHLELDGFRKLIEGVNSTTVTPGIHTLLDREEAWEQMVSLYEASYEEQSFLDYFWSYRAILGGIFSILLAPLPKAKAYHALSTGYAGLFAARAKVETGAKCMLTEHGIYTNERRVEIVSADWLQQTASKAPTIDHTRLDLRDMWIYTIYNFSHLCYEAMDEIITLYNGNQVAQREDGADPEKMKVIPNGVDVPRYSKIPTRRQDVPTIGLIGRVVPIKDIKSYIRTVHILRQQVPEIKAYIMGPTEEDEDYYNECVEMVELFGLQEHIIFTGQVRIDDYLSQIDLLVLSSLSEAQPLVVLEAGACGIPSVTTNVGACSELIYGSENETPALGDGGIVCPLANPAALAEAIYTLLADEQRYQQCSQAMRARVAQYYNREDLHETYKSLYEAA